MEKIAFISGGIFIYWSSIILTLAALAAIAIFAAMYLGKSGDVVGASVTVPLDSPVKQAVRKVFEQIAL